MRQPQMLGMHEEQALYIKEKYNKKSIILIDDLPAELDDAKRKSVIKCLESMESQSIVTGVLKKDIHSIAKDRPCYQIQNGELKSLSDTKT